MGTEEDLGKRRESPRYAPGSSTYTRESSATNTRTNMQQLVIYTMVLQRKNACVPWWGEQESAAGGGKSSPVRVSLPRLTLVRWTQRGETEMACAQEEDLVRSKTRFIS